MIGKITKVSVERLTAGEVLWDTQLVGFGARLQLRHVHYLLRYRLDGKQRFLSIGRHGMFTPDTARTEARRLLGLIATGVDPGDKRARMRAGRTETFGTEAIRYLESKRSALKARSIVEVQRHLLVYAKPLHPLPLGQIDRRAIALRLSEIEQGSGSISRNRFRSSLSAFYTWAISEGLTENNPVTGTGKASEGNGRDRVLSEDELKAILRSLGDDEFSDIVRLLILTGQRRDEIGGLRWSEIDWGFKDGAKGGLIVLPPERTKNKRQHELPMSRQVDDIIGHRYVKRIAPAIASNGRDDPNLPPLGPALSRTSIVPADGGFVFGRRFTAWSRSKADLDAKLEGVAPWRLHDLRRSAVTHMAELGALPHVIEQILNHQSGSKAGIAGLYNRAKYTEAMRVALQTYGDYIDRLSAQPDASAQPQPDVPTQSPNPVEG
jgi:integrase